MVLPAWETRDRQIQPIILATQEVVAQGVDCLVNCGAAGDCTHWGHWTGGHLPTRNSSMEFTTQPPVPQEKKTGELTACDIVRAC